MFRASVILCFITSLFINSLQASGNTERPYTFSLAQEKILAEHPKVLSFLYHMTRDRLDFDEMAQQYHLVSIPQYYAFLLENDLVKLSETGRIEFLFSNPYGAWKLQNKETSKDTVLNLLRKSGVARLEESIGEKVANIDDQISPIWITNTYRLTPEEYQAYKQELLQITKKYTDLGERNLLGGIEHRVIWVVQLADCINTEMAKTSHLLFGPVDEF